MHPAIRALLDSLSRGGLREDDRKDTATGTVGQLARVFEIARNALEFRADHLVRRAAIERILKRQLVLGETIEGLAEELLTELKWAMYVTEVEERKVSKKQVEEILSRYMAALSSNKIGRDWLVGMASAEIEEKLNPNTDYHQFTNFAFHTLKRRIHMPAVKDVDLVLYVAIDRVFSQSDEQQVSYHLFKLIRGQAKGIVEQEKLLYETWRHYIAALKSPVFNTVSAFVRKQMAPLLLLRDLYFANPEGFAGLLDDGNRFGEQATMVLEGQMMLMGGRIRTATVRSLTYVFLTKMLLIFLLEVPVERAIVGHVEVYTMAINLAFPVLFMWLMASTIKLPNLQMREKLIGRAWEIVSDFEAEARPEEMLVATRERSQTKFIVYYLFYGLLFVVTFALIVSALMWAKFNFANVFVFLFFLCVVSFFAYRIRQTASMYSYRPKAGGRTNLLEAIMLPIVVVGGVLSTGVSKLNFLVFIFDFVLEAPYKIILKFIDNWTAFLSKKQEEAVG
jgi:hypothetical protein